MNSRQIETWALRVIDCVNKRQPNEDFLVELKREWIPENKAARRIAGHANAARGENILWLIGVDEIEGVIGVDATDMASWYDQVTSCFNDLPPRLVAPLNIPVEGKTIVALLFETARAPYVVKNPCYGQKDGGSVEFEVPWREGTRTRTANRSDLIQLSALLGSLPKVEILESQLNWHEKISLLELGLQLYIIPKNTERLVIPFHKCRVDFEFVEKLTVPTQSRVFSRVKNSPTISSTAFETTVDGAGPLVLNATTNKLTLSDLQKIQDIKISIYLVPVNTELPIVLPEIPPINIYSPSPPSSSSRSYSGWVRNW